MVLPTLIHPIPVTIKQLDRLNTLLDEDAREPSGDANRSVTFTVPGQIKWFDDERLGPTQGGPQQDSDGYVLFRTKDLRASGLGQIKQGDSFVAMGRGANRVEVDVYVNSLRYMGHYTDQGGATLVRAYFKDRQPSKQKINPIANKGLASLWISSESGKIYSILDYQYEESGAISPELVLELDGYPKAFDIDSSGNVWTFGFNSPKIRYYPAADVQKSGTPVAARVMATAFERPWKLFLATAPYSGYWALDGDTGALGLFAAAQLAVSTETPIVPSTYITLSIGSALGTSEPVDFATDASGWGYVAHRRFGASGGRRIWALAPGQLAASATALVPTAENAGSNFDGNPNGIAIGPDGKVWVSMFSSDGIQAYDASALRLGGNPAPSISITASSLSGPAGLQFDADGNLLVVSRNNFKLLRISAADLASSGAKTPNLELSLGAPGDPFRVKAL